MADMSQILGKRPRVQFTSTTPGGASKGGPMPSADSRGPPGMNGIPINMSNSTISFMTNTTTSLPLMVRPWQQEFERAYRPGSPLFVFVNSSGAMHKLHTIADIPTLNWLLVERKRLGNNVPNRNGLYPTSEGTGWEYNKNMCTSTNKESLFSCWNFFGIFRNDMDANSRLQKLFNCDVFGRAKVANIFCSKRNGIRRGDHVGLAVVRFDLKRFQALHHPSGGEGMSTDFLEDSELNDDGNPDMGLLMNKYDISHEHFDTPAMKWAYQIIGTLNGVPSVDNSCLSDITSGRIKMGGKYDNEKKKLAVIKHIPLGIVTHAVSKVPSDAQRLFALKCSDDMTSLPQIEILMV